jgi:hypothetical protein
LIESGSNRASSGVPASKPLDFPKDGQLEHTLLENVQVGFQGFLLRFDMRMGRC